MNSVVLMGRLTKDPEVGRNDTTVIARYTLAVDRYGKKEEADFISCVAFGKTAEFAERFLRKGTKIAVTGRIQTGSYTNKDGNKIYTTDVIVNAHEFCESRRQDAPSDGFEAEPDDEELPFN